MFLIYQEMLLTAIMKNFPKKTNFCNLERFPVDLALRNPGRFQMTARFNKFRKLLGSYIICVGFYKFVLEKKQQTFLKNARTLLTFH